jgi:hypothetical protein
MSKHDDPVAGQPVDPTESTRDQLDRCRSALMRLRRSLATAEEANRRMVAEHAELVERESVMTRLWVAASALHEASSEAMALRAIEEVMINLAGSEDFAFFELDDAGWLQPVHAFGPMNGRLHPHAPFGQVAHALADGESWWADSPHPPDPGGDPLACLVLHQGSRVAGVVLVWSFLPQKLAFDPFDRQLYALLSHRAAPALCAARLLEAIA